LHERNIEINSEREVAALMVSFNETCTSFNLNYGSNTDVPAFQKSNGECYVSDISRQLSAFNCDRAASAGKHRLCWCHAAETKAAVGCAQGDSEDSKEISTTVIIWIIGGNILALGLVCMLCVICQERPEKTSSAPAKPDNSPDDSRMVMRCPACRCQIERSNATGTATFSRVGPKSTGFKSSKSRDSGSSESTPMSGTTVKFRDEVSEVSASQSQLGVVRETTAEESATLSEPAAEMV
jgi:hypothetical protein